MNSLQTYDDVITPDKTVLGGGWAMRCDPALDFDTPELNALRDLWFTVARRVGTPRRSDFDARSLKPFLRHVAITERIGNGAAQRYRYRFYGSALVQLMGELTGRFLDEVVPADYLASWNDAYQLVLSAGVPFRFFSRFQLPQLSFFNGEGFAASLASETSGPHLILSALYVTPKEFLNAKVS